MARVKIGNASISENGSISGKAGDQTGREVYIKSWSSRSGGWVTLRCNNVQMREWIAEAMEKACKNDDIGYDQRENKTLWNNIKDKGFDPSLTTKKVETDCARLVRVCVQYACVKAGLNITIPDFYTATLKSTLLKTGLFTELKGSKYSSTDKLLIRGDIQVTNGKGHTWVILTNGENSGAAPEPEKVYSFGERIMRNGCTGADVKELQTMLIKLGYNTGSVDGTFGSSTQTAVKAFQKDYNCDVDGEVGPQTIKALKEALDKKNTDTTTPDVPVVPEISDNVITITGGSVNIRKGPGTNYGVYKTAHKGDKFERVVSAGWVCVDYNGSAYWVSEKYVNGNICTANSLHVRRGPGTNYTSMATVKKGYEFTKLNVDGWLPITVGGAVYWVSAKYAESYMELS